MEINFAINGKEYKVNSSTVPIETSLNTFIRTNAQLRGTKFMCLEGGCGACIVTARGIHPVTKEEKSWAINSCLVPVFSCHGLNIITVEGVGNKKDGYHQVQTRLANLNGTQCGYCSPGMVMNMFSLLESKHGKVTMEEIENSFGGNICRCTGYRPILDAFKSLAVDANEKLLNVCKDIEDLNKTCPKTGNPCAGSCHIKDTKKPIHLTFEADKEWHKVYTVNEIFNVLEKIKNRPYMLVSGNTAHGVYRRSPNLEVFIDVTGVEQLRAHTIGKELTIGANVSLTEAMEILEKASTTKPEFSYCKEITKHFDLIANVPVRNIGTLAGNLSIKNEYKEFPSDVFIVLEAVGAKLTIISERGKVTFGSTIVDYLNLDMNKKLISNVILPPISSDKFVFRSFKIMPRAQNAHAYVNAAFLFEFNDEKNKVIGARICFGGINTKFTHASETEALLVGKDLYTNETLKAAMICLKKEINPDWILPDASPVYRRNLALALFYKFMLNTCPHDKLRPALRNGGLILERPISSGTQIFQTQEDKWPLTKPVRKYEGLIQCSGEAQYVNDFPYQSGELWTAFVPATKVHSIIKNIDASIALSTPGVVAFYSAKDIPGKNNFASEKLLFLFDVEEIFCSKKVLFNGQPAGLIVAETFDLANYAASLVKIEYETKVDEKIHTTMSSVFASNAVERIHEQPYNLTASEYGTNIFKTIKGKMEIGSQYHFTMEPQTCVCVPAEDGIDVYSSTQWLDLVQVAIASALNIPENSINMLVRRLGGGFGGKISRSSQIACACALACHLLNRPVRFVMTIESNMNAIGKRYACSNDYEVDVDQKGKIQNLRNVYYEDFGWSLTEPVPMNTSEFIKNCYITKSWDILSKGIITDTPSNTWCRAPGGTEGIAMIENIMEHIAKSTGQDPISVRLENMTEDNELRKLIPDFLESTEYESRKKNIDSFNEENRWRKRGISVVPMQYPIGYFSNYPVLVSIYHADGTVAISHGGIEMGQGINTKAAQVAAHVLGISLEKIKIKPSNNLNGANSGVSGGSITSESVAFAVMKACEILLERMKPVKEELKDAKWEDIAHACYMKNIELTANYMYKASDLQSYVVFGLICAELEIDILTGNVQIIRVDILEDAGQSMSPLMDIGQVEGAFVLAIGLWLTENLTYNNENGELLTNRTWNYKPPGAKDIPIDFRVKFIPNTSNKNFVLRAKAVGEPPMCMSCVILFALRYALNAARKDSGLTDEWYTIVAPVTPEQIFKYAGTSFEQFNF